MRAKNKSDRPSIKTLRGGRRVTPAEHSKFSKALDTQFGADRPRLGRPSLGPLKAKDIHLRIPPGILERLRLKAEKMGIGYQTLINQILDNAV